MCIVFLLQSDWKWGSFSTTYSVLDFIDLCYLHHKKKTIVEVLTVENKLLLIWNMCIHIMLSSYLTYGIDIVMLLLSRIPPPGMEQHIPVLFLDLNGNTFTDLIANSVVLTAVFNCTSTLNMFACTKDGWSAAGYVCVKDLFMHKSNICTDSGFI